MLKKYFLGVILMFSYSGFAQKIDDSCFWIAYPEMSGKEDGVYHFRKTFELQNVPGQLILNVSADNRYRLFVNGKAVCFGPARDDLNHWRYESIDVAPYLQKGKNNIAAVVWNYGTLKPKGQFSVRTAFYCKTEVAEINLNSNKTWQTIKNIGCHFKPVINMVDVRGGYLAAPTDSVDGNKFPWGWESNSYNDHSWKSAEEIQSCKDTSGWKLEKRQIPLMEEKSEHFSRIVYSKGIDLAPDALYQKATITIPANRKIEMLLDMAYETIGYPELLVSKGKNAKIKLKYSESLYLKNQKDLNGKFIGEAQYKGNRNITKDKDFVGIGDVFISDGGLNRLYRPLWFHVFRYVLVEIETKDEPLTIHNYENIFTAYPFEIKAAFKSSDSELNRLWDVGCRTIRIACNETFMDGYYEQLQYIGDARVESLVAMALSGDDRLTINAIDQLSHSIGAEGLTLCAYPATMNCVIPPFSLFWICMINDYMWLRKDSNFAVQYVPQIKKILDWHIKYLDAKTGMLGKMPYWHFVDWPKPWEWDVNKGTGGIPSGAEEGKSSILNLQFVYALQNAIDIFSATNNKSDLKKYQSIADQITKSVKANFWDPKKNMFSDNMDKTIFSQHANCMAVLAGAAKDSQAKQLMNLILTDTSLIKCTVYYGFFLNRSLSKAGMEDQLLSNLEPWKDMLRLGLTTFAEKQEPTRSDCHGWSTSINYEFLSTVLGINPGEHGFKTVYITPHIGDLEWVKGSYPHEKGLIHVNYRKTLKGLSLEIELPEGLNGRFEWNSRTIDLHSGINRKEFN